MSPYEERFYRTALLCRNLFSFQIVMKETDLWISAPENLEKKAEDLVFDSRLKIEAYIGSHPEFLTSLSPVENDPFSPEIIRGMIHASQKAGVGPMAAVAGAISQHVGAGLLDFTDQVIVENGGDIFLKTRGSATVSVYAGKSPLSNRLGLIIPERQMPVGVCSSSATVGHSLSLGIADVCCIISPSALLADAAATAVCNRIRHPRDLESAPEWAGQIDGVSGGIAIVRDRMAAWGDIELVDL